MSILSKNELIDCLAVVLPNSRQLNIERINKQRVNTKAIYDLDRDNLEHNSYERRMLVYSTLMNEKIFMEYWIFCFVRATIPVLGEPVFRLALIHFDFA